MFESKLILKLPPFSLIYTVREKRRQFQNELTLKHSEVIFEWSWLYKYEIHLKPGPLPVILMNFIIHKAYG